MLYVGEVVYVISLSLHCRFIMPCLHCAREILKRSFHSTMGPYSKTPFKRRLFVFMWTEHILKTELFADDGSVTLIM